MAVSSTHAERMEFGDWTLGRGAFTRELERLIDDLVDDFDRASPVAQQSGWDRESVLEFLIRDAWAKTQPSLFARKRGAK